MPELFFLIHERSIHVEGLRLRPLGGDSDNHLETRQAAAAFAYLRRRIHNLSRDSKRQISSMEKERIDAVVVLG